MRSALAGDPRCSNREKEAVDIHTQELPAYALDAGLFRVSERSGGGPHGMPPGSIFMHVFEEVR